MTITNVKLMEHLTDELDMCHMEFDGGTDSAYIVWNYTNLLEYLGGEAVVTFRQDFYKGSIAKFVNTLARVGVIKTLEKESNIKLYTASVDNHSTICFRDIAEGTTVNSVVVYVVDVSFDSTARANWCDFRVMDRERKIATLRLFSPTTRDAEFKGRYVMCNIRRNQYGFSTESLTTIDTVFELSPEVTVAEKFITDAFADDKEMLAVLQASSFIPFCKRAIAEEPGYGLVRLAIELDICNEMANLVQDTNFTLVRQALLFTHFDVLNSESVYEKGIVNFVTISKYPFTSKKDVLQLLFSDVEHFKREREMLRSIQKLADSAVRVKKGMV